jgi:WD40 repeat protein
MFTHEIDRCKGKPWYMQHVPTYTHMHAYTHTHKQAAMFTHEIDRCKGKPWYMQYKPPTGAFSLDSMQEETTMWLSDSDELICTLQDRKGYYEKMDLSKDQSMLVTCGGSDDKTTIQLLQRGYGNYPGAELVKWTWQPNYNTLPVHTDKITCAVFSPDFSLDNQKIATTSRDGSASVIMWDAVAGVRQLKFLGHHGPVLCAAWSSDSKLLATGGEDKQILLWDHLTGNTVMAMPEAHSGSVTCVILGADMSFLVSASQDKTITIFNLELHDGGTCSIRYRLEGHTEEVTGLSLSPNQEYVSSWGTDQTVRMWNIITGSPIRDIAGMSLSLYAYASCLLC